ncbi:MAG: hypothetical protein HY864_00855 [Chloroflexi bacterium]|nr:hypothetical protein [Chloroflexota bacterium]
MTGEKKQKRGRPKKWEAEYLIKTTSEKIAERMNLLVSLDESYSRLLGAGDAEGLLKLAARYEKLNAPRIARRIVLEAGALL